MQSGVAAVLEKRCGILSMSMSTETFVFVLDVI